MALIGHLWLISVCVFTNHANPRSFPRGMVLWGEGAGGIGTPPKYWCGNKSYSNFNYATLYMQYLLNLKGVKCSI